MSSKNTEEFDCVKNEVDDLLDQYFLNASTCHDVRDIAIWNLLTAFEDGSRFTFTGALDCEFGRISGILDETKYALKHALDVINRDSKPHGITINQKVNGNLYRKSCELMEFGINYHKIYRTLSSAYNGDCTFHKTEHGYVSKSKSIIDHPYGILEIVGHGQEPIFDYIVLAYVLLRGDFRYLNEEEYSKINREILDYSNARTRKNIVNYTYNHNYAYYLIRKIHQRPKVIPDNFQFPWGSGHETQMLINSFNIRCLYHILIVNSLAVEKQTLGGNNESIVLKISKKNLIDDISALTGELPQKNIETFIDFLTYGKNVVNPDPALQPIFPTQSEFLLIPCCLSMSNNTQRNVLSLYARTNDKSFNKQSKLFEESMILEAEPWLKKFKYYCTNKTFSNSKSKEEIDVLILDPEQKFILLLEFRWFLQPGDAREVQQRINVCGQKVKQLERKIEYIRKDTFKILKNQFKDIKESENWNVEGCVVIKGFGGRESRNSNIPIITLDVLNLGATEINNLSELYFWVKSKSWLPVEGIHYKSLIEEVDLDGVSVSRPALEIKVSPDTYLKHVASTLA